MQSVTAVESISRKKTGIGMVLRIADIQKPETDTCRGRKGKVGKTQIKSMSIEGFRKFKANQLKLILPCRLYHSGVKQP